MLNEKQRSLAQVAPKVFLEQFRLLRLRAENELGRADFWQSCDISTEYCAECVKRARELVTLESDIANALYTAEIKDEYKTFLHLRYIECLTINEISARMHLARRWLQRLQNKALSAFSSAL